jgi:hypothetical protein
MSEAHPKWDFEQRAAFMIMELRDLIKEDPIELSEMMQETRDFLEEFKIFQDEYL